MNATCNPFVNRTVITDINDFHGRQTQLNHISTRLQRMQSASIVGARRIGKSSLLHFLSHGGLGRAGNQYLFVHLDLQSARCHTLSGFLQTILSKCDCNPSVILNANSKSKNLVAFTDELLIAPKSRQKIVLCLDEFENTFKHPTQFGEDFFDHMRSQISRRRFALVTATKHPLQILCLQGQMTSPFYNVFTQITLGEWIREEAESFVEKHKTSALFTEEELQFINSPLELHPLKLQIVCDHVIRNRAQGLSQQELRKSIVEDVQTFIVPSRSPRQLHRLQRIFRHQMFKDIVAAIVRKCTVLLPFY